MAASILIIRSMRMPQCSSAAAAAMRIRMISTGDSSGETIVRPLKDPRMSALKKGTGGRSSFSGVVATVFGANGFVGNNVCNQLGKKGTQLIIPHRSDFFVVRRLKLTGDLGQVLFMPFNLKDEALIHKAMKHSNVVINLIGKDCPTSNFSFHDVHVKGAQAIARIARECGVQRLIHVSALNCAEKPTGVVLKGGSQFLATKWEGEQVVRQEFPDAVIFRPSDIYGQGDRFLEYFSSIWRRNFTLMPLWNKGEGVVKQPVYVSDVAKGIVKAAFDPDVNGKTFQAVGPRRYELCELIDWFYRVMRKCGDWGYRRTDLKYDLSHWLRIAILTKFSPKYPLVTWETIEREMVSDDVDDELPTLEDLGVVLTTMEERVPSELHQYRAFAYYEESLGEFEEPAPPRVYAS